MYGAKENLFDYKNRDRFNTTGLKKLYWELFDSPDSVGSAFNFMEREPVLILDDIVVEFQDWRPRVDLAYVSKQYGDIIGLPSSSSHRVGKAVRLRATDPRKRMFIVKNLILRGITRIGVGMNHVYFDTDNYLYKDSLYIQ